MMLDYGGPLIDLPRIYDTQRETGYHQLAYRLSVLIAEKIHSFSLSVIHSGLIG